MTESFAELFEQSQQAISKLKPGAIVTGIVVEIRNDVVVINAGLKSEGIVPIEQFKDESGELEVQVGDEVKVALDALEDGFCETKASRASLPGSLVDVRPARDPVYLEGKDLEFKIIKLDRKRNNVVVSRRAVVETEFSEEREKLLERLTEGAVVKGTVKNLTDYGAFVDLGGIDGLLHITDMAWKRVKHAAEVAKLGDA